MSAAHTPGPWKATKARKSSNFGDRTAFVQASVSIDGKPTFISTVAKVPGGPRDEPGVAEANARLIAAAPDLRDVAEAMLLFHGGGVWSQEKRARWLALTGGDEANTRTLCDFARAALARVTGAPS